MAKGLSKGEEVLIFTKKHMLPKWSEEIVYVRGIVKAEYEIKGFDRHPFLVYDVIDEEGKEYAATHEPTSGCDNYLRTPKEYREYLSEAISETRAKIEKLTEREACLREAQELFLGDKEDIEKPKQKSKK